MGNKNADDTVLEGRWAAQVELSQGGVVRIRKCRVKDIKLVTNFVGIVARELGLDTNGKMKASLSDANTILQLISTCADQIYLVCAALTDKELDFLEDLDIDEGLKVVLAAYELNKSFFVQQVYPLVAPLLQQHALNENKSEELPQIGKAKEGEQP